MIHTVHDVNPARLNSIMPTLRLMEDDPAFLDYRERRFEQNDPPPPYSSRSTTREPTPDPFRGYDPRRRYNEEKRQEKERIEGAWRKRDENYAPLHRGPDLIGRPGQQREYIMARHSIKRRWQQLGVWYPGWGVPTDEFGGFGNGDGPKCWPWDSLGQDAPESRAIRRYLQKKLHRKETFTQQTPEADSTPDVPVDDRQSPITSRPWFRWSLEVAEEETRLWRNPERTGTYIPARANVTARWKEKGWRKDSWSDNLPQGHDWRSLPGWKWRHESPSPEPSDPNDMEFTPSEIDALEAIRPPTPPPPPTPWSLENQPRSPGARPMKFLFWDGVNAAPPGCALPKLIPTDDSGDDKDCRPGAVAANAGGDLVHRSSEGDVDMEPCAGQSRPSACGPSGKQQRRLNGRTTCSTPRAEISSPDGRKPRLGRKATRAPSLSSKVSKLTPTRRSLRIAKREGRLESIKALSGAPKAISNNGVAPQPQLSEQAGR